MPRHHEAYDAGCWFALRGHTLEQARIQARYWGMEEPDFLNGYRDGFITCPIG
jgi:hypothetical protein